MRRSSTVSILLCGLYTVNTPCNRIVNISPLCLIGSIGCRHSSRNIRCPTREVVTCICYCRSNQCSTEQRHTSRCIFTTELATISVPSQHVTITCVLICHICRTICQNGNSLCTWSSIAFIFFCIRRYLCTSSTSLILGISRRIRIRAIEVLQIMENCISRIRTRNKGCRVCNITRYDYLSRSLRNIIIPLREVVADICFRLQSYRILIKNGNGRKIVNGCTTH